MPDPVVTPYIISTVISTAVNAVSSTVNGIIQREAQYNALTRQLEHQKKLQEQGYLNQIALQLQNYRLNNAWPLAKDPAAIANGINIKDSRMPLYCIIAPAAGKGIQRAYVDVWTNLSNFLAGGYFSHNIIQVKYRGGFECNPNADIGTIWEELKSVPVLYIAPYSKEAENILGVTIAMWEGWENIPPIAKTFEFDLHKLLIDETRRVTYQFKADCDADRGTFKGDLAKNFEIFEAEKEKLQRGADFYQLDRIHQFYKDVKTVSEVHYAMMNKITPVLKTICTGLIDALSVLTFGNKPFFQKLVTEYYNAQYEFPDLYITNCSSAVNQQQMLLGNDFLKTVYTDYAKAIACRIEPVAGIKNIQYLLGELPGTENCFEKELVEQWFPNTPAPEKLSHLQIKIIDAIADVSGIEETKYFSQFSKMRKKLPPVDTEKENKLIIDHFLARMRQLKESINDDNIYIKPNIPSDKLNEYVFNPSEVLLLFSDSNSRLLITEKAEVYASVVSGETIYAKLYENKLTYGATGFYINKHFIASHSMIRRDKCHEFTDIVNILSDISVNDLYEENVCNEKISDFCNTFRKDFRGESHIFLSPEIPVKKQENAIRSYAPTLKSEDIFILADDTVFGGAREGFIISKKGWIYAKAIARAPMIPTKIDENVSIIVRGDYIYINDKSFMVFPKNLKQQHFDIIKNMFIK